MGVINFDNVQDTGRPMTSPGTIAVFEISKIEFKLSKEKNSPYAELEFTEEGGATGFRESFYLTEKALPRLQHVAINFMGAKLAGDLTEEQIVAKLSKKRGGLKVGGRVSSNGKGYPSLAFGGFAKPAGQVGELSFTAAEEAQNTAAIEAIKNSQSSQADSEGSGGGNTPPPSGDLEF
jgi:hypothetical protein